MLRLAGNKDPLYSKAAAPAQVIDKLDTGISPATPSSQSSISLVSRMICDLHQGLRAEKWCLLSPPWENHNEEAKGCECRLGRELLVVVNN